MSNLTIEKKVVINQKNPVVEEGYVTVVYREKDGNKTFEQFLTVEDQKLKKNFFDIISRPNYLVYQVDLKQEFSITEPAKLITLSDQRNDLTVNIDFYFKIFDAKLITQYLKEDPVKQLKAEMINAVEKSFKDYIRDYSALCEDYSGFEKTKDIILNEGNFQRLYEIAQKYGVKITERRLTPILPTKVVENIEYIRKIEQKALKHGINIEELNLSPGKSFKEIQDIEGQVDKVIEKIKKIRLIQENADLYDINIETKLSSDTSIEIIKKIESDIQEKIKKIEKDKEREDQLEDKEKEANYEQLIEDIEKEFELNKELSADVREFKRLSSQAKLDKFKRLIKADTKIDENKQNSRIESESLRERAELIQNHHGSQKLIVDFQQREDDLRQKSELKELEHNLTQKRMTEAQEHESKLKDLVIEGLHKGIDLSSSPGEITMFGRQVRQLMDNSQNVHAQPGGKTANSPNIQYIEANYSNIQSNIQYDELDIPCNLNIICENFINKIINCNCENLYKKKYISYINHIRAELYLKERADWQIINKYSNLLKELMEENQQININVPQEFFDLKKELEKLEKESGVYNAR